MLRALGLPTACISLSELCPAACGAAFPSFALWPLNMIFSLPTNLLKAWMRKQKAG